MGGVIGAFSDQILFFENGTFVEENLQTQLMTVGAYRVQQTDDDETLCFLERTYLNENGQSQTDCETLTISAKARSVEGLVGCEIRHHEPLRVLRVMQRGRR